VTAVREHIPLVTIEPRNVSWSAIAGGREDTYIHLLAERTGAYGKPIYFRIAPEMNGQWAPWRVTPGMVAPFRAAWARIAREVRPAGGRMIWCPNDSTSRGLALPTTYYPGTSQVDVIGIDSYTWDGGRTSFNGILARPYALYSALDAAKDVWVCETGCNRGPNQAKWVADMLKSTKYHRLKHIVYFDSLGSKDWRLNSPATIAALREALGSSPSESRRPG
jgi:beta-mannanase